MGDESDARPPIFKSIVCNAVPNKTNRAKRRAYRALLRHDTEPKLLDIVQYFMGPSQGEPERPVLSKVEARQGVTGHNVRYVLGFGLAAVIIVFAAVYLFYFH
jgi:hypothetical protein